MFIRSPNKTFVCSICGTLHSVDQYLNIKLTDISVTDPDKYPHMVCSAYIYDFVCLIVKEIVTESKNTISFSCL